MKKLMIVLLATGALAGSYYLTKGDSASAPTVADVPAEKTEGAGRDHLDKNGQTDLQTHQEAPPISQPSLDTTQSPSANDTSTQAYGDTADQTFTSMADTQKEEKLRELLIAKGSDADKYIEVQSLVCDQGSCTVEAIAKGDPGRFQMTMATLLEQNPWLGTSIKMNTPPGQPGIATFKFVKE